VDLAAGEVRKNGHRIRLQENPLRVLALLAERQGQVVSREELRKHLWPEDTFVDFENGLNAAVSKLRDALSDSVDQPRFIETIPRRGYRFLVPVESQNGQSAVTDTIEKPQTPTPEFTLPPRFEPSPQAELQTTISARPASFKSLWLLLAVGIALLAGGAYWLTHGRAALSFHSRDSALLADIDNQTGDPRFDTALQTAFHISIEQSRYANIVPRLQVESVLDRMGKPQNSRITPALGREICQREGIRGLIVTSITRTGREYALTAQLIDPKTGETAKSFTERAADEDHILDALDSLAKEVRGALGESLYQIQQANKPLPRVTTRSLSALQHYSEGLARWHRGDFADAATQYKEAVASDPDFAMAHASLGGAYYSFIFNQPEDGQKEYEKALSLSSRTTDREREMIEARYAGERGHFSDADLLYRNYLNEYPDDVSIRFSYANLLRGAKRESDAIEQYNEVLRTAPDFAHAYLGLATTYKTLNDIPKALQAYSKAFEIDPEWLTRANLNREYGFTLVLNGEDQKAEQVFSQMLAQPKTRENGLRSLAFLDLYRGQYASAQNRLQQSLDLLRGQNAVLSLARVHLLLAIVDEGRGNLAAERRNLDIALSNLNDIQTKVVFGSMLGAAYARAGLADQAQKIAAIITPLADQKNLEQMAYLHLLQGEIALANGEHDQAVDLLKQSDKEKSTGLTTEALAHGYQESGATDEAIVTYQKMLGSIEPALGWEPQQRWLEARYTLAMDYASRGERDSARQTLQTLLNLWKNADPNLPLLKKVKDEYARLE
jgi:DNA-binding winged helix-turn-helix (wHTH) protein/tetratricopeptide (TPR) repeat protein